MNLTDEELIQELTERFSCSRKAFADLSVVNRKLVEMNVRLTQSESLKSNFLSNIRNEINNPLNVIQGLAGHLALLGEGEGSEITRLAVLIATEAQTLDFQLHNIFIAAELEAGEIDPHVIPTNIPALLEDVVESFRSRGRRKNVQLDLKVHSGDKELWFPTDGEKLEVVLSNLIANAVEFSEPCGTVSITCWVTSRGLELSVRDEGLGIAFEDQARIFDRFVQLESGSTRPHPGNGLGLSICKALVDLLQGAIKVESVPGKGAFFTVSLPLPLMDQSDNEFAEGGNLFLFEDRGEPT